MADAESVQLVETEQASLQVMRGVDAYSGTYRTNLMCYGEHDAVLTLLEQVEEEIDFVQIPSEIAPEVLAHPERFPRIGTHEGPSWEMFYTLAPLPNVTSKGHFVILDGAANETEIRTCLEQGNPTTAALDRVPDHSWFGIRDDAGLLVSVMGYSEFSGRSGQLVTHFEGLGTLPSERGKGYGSALMYAAVDHVFETRDAVVFGMWDSNEGARRLYNRLGYSSAGVVTPLTKTKLEWHV